MPEILPKILGINANWDIWSEMVAVKLPNIMSGSITFEKMYIFELRFTPCKAEQTLRSIELQEKEKKRLRHTGNLFTIKDLKSKDVC